MMPTGSVVDGRLTELKDLLELTQSLRTARGAFLDDEQMLARCLRLDSNGGRVIGPNRLSVRARSERLLHVGFEFDALCRGVPIRSIEARHAVLVGVTLNDDRPADSLPPGSWCTVVLDFMAEVPEVLSHPTDLPVAMASSDMLRLWCGNRQ